MSLLSLVRHEMKETHTPVPTSEEKVQSGEKTSFENTQAESDISSAAGEVWDGIPKSKEGFIVLDKSH